LASLGTDKMAAWKKIEAFLVRREEVGSGRMATAGFSF